MFVSYGFTGFKNFIVDSDKNIINRTLYSINNINKKDDIVSLVSLKFLEDAYQNLNRSELAKLSATAADCFQQTILINECAKLHNIKNEILLYLVDDQLQESNSYTCSIFQLYFYNKLAKSEIINGRKSIRHTISKLLNELVSLDRKKKVW